MSTCNPSGRIVRRAIAKITDDETQTTMTASAPAIVIRILNNNRTRNNFLTDCKRRNVLAIPLPPSHEASESFNRRTGKRQGEGGAILTDIWQIMGNPSDLEAIASERSTLEWHFIVSARVPISCGGSGEMTERAKGAARFAQMPKPEKQAIVYREEAKGKFC